MQANKPVLPCYRDAGWGRRRLGQRWRTGLLRTWASQVAQWQRICLPMQEMWIPSLSQEDPLEKEMATHSSILAWKIPQTEEPGGLQSMGSHRVRHDLATKPQPQLRVNRLQVLVSLILISDREQCWVAKVGTCTQWVGVRAEDLWVYEICLLLRSFLQKCPVFAHQGTMVFIILSGKQVRPLTWKLSTKESMLLNCGAGEVSWESLGLHIDQASQS